MDKKAQHSNVSIQLAILVLEGNFFFVNRDEIINLILNIKQREQAKDPLKRIMAIEEEDKGILISTK